MMDETAGKMVRTSLKNVESTGFPERVKVKLERKRELKGDCKPSGLNL